MSPKKGDRVSVPPLSGWNVIHGTTEAATGWEELCRGGVTSAVIQVYASPRHPKDTE